MRLPLAAVHVGEKGHGYLAPHLLDEFDGAGEGALRPRGELGQEVLGGEGQCPFETKPAANSSGVQSPLSKACTQVQPSQRVHSSSSLAIPASRTQGPHPAGLDQNPAQVEEHQIDGSLGHRR